MKILLITAASAALLAPVAAQAQLFNGPYAGVDLGWESTDGVIGDGLSYGAVLGYNATVRQNLVMGVESKLGFSTADHTEDFGDGTSTEIDAGRSFGLAGRLGYLASPTTMFFGKVGYENVRTKVEFKPEDTSGSFNVDALLLGGGVELGLNDRTSLRVGYDYTNGESGFARHQLKAGVAMHF